MFQESFYLSGKFLLGKFDLVFAVQFARLCVCFAQIVTFKINSIHFVNRIDQFYFFFDYFLSASVSKRFKFFFNKIL